MLGRAIIRRCPRCGGRHAFRGWAALKEHCPTCGLMFEREPGYWVGAMIINMAATLIAFLGTIALGIALTWPDVAWDALFVATIAVALLVPVLFYPWSKSIWMATELSYHKLEEREQFEASLRAAGTTDS